MTTILAMALLIMMITGIAAMTLAAIRLGDRRWARRVRSLDDNRRPWR